MKFVFISSKIPELASKRICEMVGKPSNEIKVLYITTPQNTYSKDADWIIDAKNDLLDQKFIITAYDIENKNSDEVKAGVNNNDIVWISGGNTFYFLYWAEKVGLKEILSNFLIKGGIYAGESAGVVCQIKDLEPIKWADNPDKAPELVKEGMQLTDLVVIPHWNDKKYGPIMEKVKVYYENKNIKPYLLEDGQALIVNGENIEFIKKMNPTLV